MPEGACTSARRCPASGAFVALNLHKCPGYMLIAMTCRASCPNCFIILQNPHMLGIVADRVVCLQRVFTFGKVVQTHGRKTVGAPSNSLHTQPCVTCDRGKRNHSRKSSSALWLVALEERRCTDVSHTFQSSWESAFERQIYCFAALFDCWVHVANETIEESRIEEGCFDLAF